jgi:hypothetical protein
MTGLMADLFSELMEGWIVDGVTRGWMALRKML